MFGVRVWSVLNQGSRGEHPQYTGPFNDVIAYLIRWRQLILLCVCSGVSFPSLVLGLQT